MASKIRKIFNLIIAILICIPSISYGAGWSAIPDVMGTIRNMVSQWYFVFRYLSIATMLVILIYLGIKLAISSIAEQKATYKRMMVDWVVGFVIIFMIHYYMVFILSLNSTTLGIVTRIKEDMWRDYIKEGEVSSLIDVLEPSATEELRENLLPTTENLYELVRTRAYELRFSVGTTGMIMYMVLVYYTIKFAFIYFKRFFTLLILTIIAPLMGLFYAFNKITSGKGVTFGKWATEYAFNVFLQTIHALTYTIFVYLAIVLSIESIVGFILAMVMLNFMGEAEKIFRKIFKLSGKLTDDNANKGIKENLAAATAMKASMGAVLGNQIAKDVNQGIRNVAGAVGNVGASAALRFMNYGVDDKKLEEAEAELAKERSKQEKDQSAEKIKNLENTISEINALKANVQKYRGGIKDPEKLKANIDKKINSKKETDKRNAKLDEEANQAKKSGKEFDREKREQQLIAERTRELEKENDRKIVKKDKYKNVFTGEIERVSVGKVLKADLNEKLWGTDEIKAGTKEMFDMTITGIKGMAMVMGSIPMIITEPVVGMAVLGKGISNAKKLYGDNEYRKLTNLAERNSIRRVQIRKIKKYKEERKKIKKDNRAQKKQRRTIKKYLKQTGNPTNLKFNRFNVGSLETIRAQLRMDKKLNSIRKMRTLTVGNFLLTAPLRFTGTLGAVRTLQSKAYKLEEARKEYYEKVETFMTLEKKDSASKDFILDYNIMLEGIKNGVEAKTNAEVIEKFGEDSGKIVTVGDNKFIFGKDIKASSPVEIKTQVIDNVLLKVAARNKVLDIKDLNLTNNKIQTQLVEEFRKVGVLDETIKPEEFEIDKTLKLNLNKLEDRINIIAKENPKAVEETIAKEVIVEYMEKNHIEDANVIKEEGHREKIKQEILQVIEECDEFKTPENMLPKSETSTDYSEIIISSAKSLDKSEKEEVSENLDKYEKIKVSENVNTLRSEEILKNIKDLGIEEKIKPQDIETLIKGLGVEKNSEKIESEEIKEILEETETSEAYDFGNKTSSEVYNFEDMTTRKQREEKNKKPVDELTSSDSPLMEKFLKQADASTSGIKKEKRLELFENLIDSLEKSEPSKMEDMIENEVVAEERKRQVGIEKEELDTQLRGFEDLIKDNKLETIEDVKAVEDYIENETSPEVDELLSHLLTLKEQDMIGVALKFKPNSYEQKRMNSSDSDRINNTYKKKI